MALVSIEQLRVTAKPNKVLVDDVNCALARGEIMAIIGPNGAGKSSVLNAVAGDLPYSGRIEIEGLAEGNEERARQVAVLPQLSLLNFPYRVFEVVQLARIPHCTGKARDAEIINEVLALMDIADLKQRLYTELSGGEKQRVQLARVLAQIWDSKDAENETRLLLLDEPSSALDLGHQRDLMRVIRQFAGQGVAVITVLHDLNLAARYADKVLALHKGRQHAFGSVEQVLTKENIRHLFGIDAEVIKHPKANTPVVIGH